MLGNLVYNPVEALIALFALVATVTVHEFAHAKTADTLGDPTPHLQGRVTLNPTAHLDLVGSILFLLVGFGWGKPVQFDPFNLKNPRRDSGLISIAGPGSNLLMAVASSLLLYLFNFIGFADTFVIGLLYWLVRWNIILGIFNLLPFAPLDGFKIVGGFLSERQARDWYSLERYGFIFLLFAIFPLIGNRSMIQIFLIPVIQFILGLLIP